MKTRNFIAVLVLMLGAFSMVIGQEERFYKVSTFKTYKQNSSGDWELERLIDMSHTVYVNLSSNFISMPMPEADGNMIRVEFSVKNDKLEHEEDGTPFINMDVTDPLGNSAIVLLMFQRMIVSFNYKGYDYIYRYELTKID